MATYVNIAEAQLGSQIITPLAGTALVFGTTTTTGGIATGGGLVLDGTDYFNFITDLKPGVTGGDPLIDYGTNDVLTGTANNDDISVHKGNDKAYGGAGNDVFHDLVSGNDQFFGDAGLDTFYLGKGNDVANGGAGNDTVNYTGINYTVIADLSTGFAFADGIDQLISIENVVGSEWNDTIKGNNLANQLSGGDGNDTLWGRGGADVLYGGNGNDTMMGNDGKNAVVTTRGPGFEDRMYGQGGNDKMSGDDGRDFLDGGIGNDTINGGRGNDMIVGGAGIDTLTGGLGADTFVFNSLNDVARYDRITDFQHGVDKIDVSAIDANPDIEGNQAFKFVSIIRNGNTADGVSVHPGPVIDGHTGYIDVRYSGGNTYIYLGTDDDITGASIVLNGSPTISASDFIM